MRVAMRVAAVVVLGLWTWAGGAAQETKEVYQGEAAERFLREARVGRIVDLGTGVTNPQQVMLRRDGVERRALYKSIDVDKFGATPMGDGSVVVAFQDTWQTEIAAYEVDKIIGLGLVPATVERTIRGVRGSLQWWVEAMMPEAQRRQEGLSPPDVDAWNKRVYKMRLFDVLICNVDRHLNNILVTADFDLRLIDHSRSFRPFDTLEKPETLTMFSRALLAGIERLEPEDLKKRIGRYVREGQIRALLARRDAILALVKARIAAEGEAAVLYD